MNRKVEDLKQNNKQNLGNKKAEEHDEAAVPEEYSQYSEHRSLNEDDLAGI